jgi:glycosyltransferase involved in cell wall biosynthesis
LNAYTVPSDYEDKYVQNKVWSRTGVSEDISVGFRNIKYFSHLSRTRKLRVAARQWAEKNTTEDKIVVLVYGMQSSLLTAAIEVKKIIPESHIYLIVPDLPQYMDMAMSIVKKILKKVDWIKIRHQLNLVKGYILYTKHMAKVLNLQKDNWIVMEGTLNLRDYTNNYECHNKNNKISVMYSGNIDRKYGIIELIKAIEIIDDEEYEFWFSGTGNAVNDIIERAKFDNRIKYLGFLPSREALMQKQQEATMLINMRLPSEKGSAYCFPSKIFEYMASGRPVLSFKIEGIPDEYYNYIIEMKSTSAKDVASAIKYVANMPPQVIHEIGNNAREFIINNKIALIQTQKIIDFIN